MRSLSKFWSSLPFDGQGLLAPGKNLVLNRLRRQSAAAFWSRAPRWSHAVLIPLARFSWLLRILYARPLRSDCLLSGATPGEAWIWRRFFSPEERHPLPGRAAGVLLSRLGEPSAHRAFADKLYTAAELSRAGLPVPRSSSSRRSIVKPRFGSASRGIVVIDREETIVQDCLEPHGQLSEFSSAGLPPVLRITTARYFGCPAFFHSALLEIGVPGESPREFIRGRLRAPVTADGLLTAGIWFARPDKRYQRLFWNGAQVEGIRMPCFEQAVELVLQAAEVMPPVSIVNWDVVVTPEGPVILEGNTCGDWILTNLSRLSGIETVSLEPLLESWTKQASWVR